MGSDTTRPYDFPQLEAQAASEPTTPSTTSAPPVRSTTQRPHRIPLEVRTEVIHGVRRANGQLAAVSQVLGEGADCLDVLWQLTSGKNAVERAGVCLLSSGLIECLSNAVEDDPASEQFEKLFLELA